MIPGQIHRPDAHGVRPLHGEESGRLSPGIGRLGLRPRAAQRQPIRVGRQFPTEQGVLPQGQLPEGQTRHGGAVAEDGEKLGVTPELSGPLQIQVAPAAPKASPKLQAAGDGVAVSVK